MVSHIKPEKVIKSVAGWMQTQIARGDQSIPIEQAKHWQSALDIAARHIPQVSNEELQLKKISFLGVKTGLQGCRLEALLRNDKATVEIFAAMLEVLENLNPEPINPEPPLKGV